MGFVINEWTTTRLHYKDISVIAIAVFAYKVHYENKADKEILERMGQLIDRLGYEMADKKYKSRKLKQ